jgi:hypothetical protein
VQSMAGVFTTSTDRRDIAAAMQRSRGDWCGPITAPAILDRTPEAMAMALLSAIEVSLSI